MEELKKLRKKREKHFLNNDGTITCYMYNHDVHYLKNGEYEEIDNQLIETTDRFENKNNEFHSVFYKNSSDLVSITKDDYYLKIYLKKEDKLVAKLNNGNIEYKNLHNNIDFKYQIIGSKIKESIILNCKETIPSQIEFLVETNLDLELTENKEILAKNKDEIIFVVESPFMVDAIGNINYCLDYQLKDKNLTLILDYEWLKDSERIYPVTIDPTIVNGHNNDVFDTYISSKYPDTTFNYDTFLKIGSTMDEVCRILMRFNLPTIGTGDDIIEAKCFLNPYDKEYDIPYEHHPYADVHEITSLWDETTATWNNMANNYNPLLEDAAKMQRTVISADPEVNGGASFDITGLVKKWYAGLTNNGIMLKYDNESDYEVAPFKFLSKTYDIYNGTGLRPCVIITYRNQNGLEDYMTYTSKSITEGTIHINNLTGNLTTTFNVNKTIAGKYPISLNLIYNTNDVVLENNLGYGLGWNFNLHETIEEVNIDNYQYLKYVDGDGTTHYFVNEENNYIDEDGLGLVAVLENNNYIITDKDNNKLTFIKNNNKWYLRYLEDAENNQVEVKYDNNNRIIQVKDADDKTINITYNNDITITSDYETTKLEYNNDILEKIITKKGTYQIKYNNKIITKIFDVNGLSFGLEYFDVIPYKVKKVTHYGLNNAIGEYLNFEYGFCVTRIIDNNGKYITYTFNNRGNTINVTNLNHDNNLNNAMGKISIYDKDNLYNTKINKNINKLQIDYPPIKFTKNLISNTSFESNCPNQTNECARSGNYSFKIDGPKYLENTLEGKKTYTFSGYFKNNKSINLRILSGEIILSTLNIPPNNDFTRYNLTFKTDSEGLACLKLYSEEVAYMDDIQFEEGDIANYYNLVENPCFENGFEGWNISCEKRDILEDEEGLPIYDYDVITLPNNVNALKLPGGPTIQSDLSKLIIMNGKKGDIYNLSFWYKNQGKHELLNDTVLALLDFGYIEKEDSKIPGEPDKMPLNNHDNEWQFFSGSFVAYEDYTSIYFALLFGSSLNNFYITNISITKDISHDQAIYNHETGNMDSFRNKEAISEFKYDKNNQLTGLFNPKGNNFQFEYDNTKITRVLKGISPTGISNEIKYDENGNPIKTIINNVNPDNEVLNNHKYYIRLKATDKYFDINHVDKNIYLKEDNCNPDYFEVIKNNDYYQFKLGRDYLTISNNVLIYGYNSENSTLFKIEKNNNGSYLIIPKIAENKVLSVNNDAITLKDKSLKDNTEEFYFEDVLTPMFIETKAIYDESKKFVTETIDSLGRKTVYDIDEVTGLTNSITDPSETTTHYTYDNKERITKVEKNEKVVNYEYNSNNLLSKITSGNKEYQFSYDDFLNTKDIKINDNTLITNEYESNNGNLTKSTYGNNSVIEYTYDDLDRVKTIKTDNHTYTNIYDNEGNLARIKDETNYQYNYYYDLSKRLSKYEENYYGSINSIDYDYDVNDNIVNKKYFLDSYGNEEVSYEYNKDDAPTKVIFDNNTLNYQYDYLGRLISKDLNNTKKVEYTYLSNGNKTSTIIKSMKINDDVYEYSYDKLSNITDIYLNKELISHYEYDVYNELISVMDYQNNKKYLYAYDAEGNILSKKEYNLEDNSLIREDGYTYSNVNWSDQLTKCNNDIITYDNIGNPLTIGSKEISWINGRELQSIKDGETIISFKYNKDGIRKEKRINNRSITYFTEGSKIIFERRGNNKSRCDIL